MTNLESSSPAPDVIPTHVLSHEAVIEQQKNKERALNNARIVERLGEVGLLGSNAKSESTLEEPDPRLTDRLGPSQ